MSASRDQSQKFTFVYKNLYHLYRKGKDAAHAAEVPPPMKPEKLAEMKNAETRGIETAKILKSEDLHTTQNPLGVRVTNFEPPRLLGKRIEANQIAEARLHPSRTEAIEGLRDNLKTLQGLHERLRFMLRELEELTKHSS